MTLAVAALSHAPSFGNVDPGGSTFAEIGQAIDEVKAFVADYRERLLNPYHAADIGQIDEVIEPSETRLRLIRALEVLRTKVHTNIAKKHGLFPV